MSDADKYNSTFSDESKTFEGTCQACFGTFVVRYGAAKGWHVVKHGYTRPGDGFTRGNCNGESCAPFEISKALTEGMLQSSVDGLLIQQGLLSDFQAGRINTLSIQVARLPQEMVFGATKMKTISIGRNYVGEHGKDFNQFLDERGADTVRRIGRLKAQISFLTAKVESWVYAPEALRTHEAAKMERADRTSEQKLERRKHRAYKLFFEMLAEVIREHARLTRGYVEAQGYEGLDQVQRNRNIAYYVDQMGVVGPMVRVKTKKAK